MPLAFFVDTPFLTTPSAELTADEERSGIADGLDDATLEGVTVSDDEIDDDDEGNIERGVSLVSSCAMMLGLSVSKKSAAASPPQRMRITTPAMRTWPRILQSVAKKSYFFDVLLLCHEFGANRFLELCSIDARGTLMGMQSLALCRDLLPFGGKSIAARG